ncbi:MAG TPA: glutamate 5-kinase [Gammaproteobacteria bacterium]|nr:glutamate 5-kinase [Gammaproteobacteria bacterium]
MDAEERRSRQTAAESRRWVVKIGSALATRDGMGLNAVAIGEWADQLAALRRAGRDVVVVTSGAVAEGAARLGWKVRPHSLHQLQAAAAIGQMGLVHCWEMAFKARGLLAAQILLTHEDIANRERYLNSRSTLLTLLQLGVVPVINENDTVATEEIKLGDNDTLAGLVSNLVDADLLVILTDQDGLMTADPRHEPNASLIGVAQAEDPRLLEIAGDGGAWGRGGMRTKVTAARLAARSATSTVIAGGRRPGVLLDLAAGRGVGTLLTAPATKLAARKLWLAGTLHVRGRLTLDAGACRVLREQGKSLLPVGVVAVDGEFERGELVSCVDQQGREIARGLVNYGAREAQAIKGLPSSRLEDALGYLREPELIHRDNLALV